MDSPSPTVVRTMDGHVPGLRDAPRLLARSLAELWQRRELLWNLTVRDLKAQYEQSFLGYAWALLNPLLHLAVLTFVFSFILRAGSVVDTPFPLFLIVGLVPWLFFANAVSMATESVSGSANLITKVYFPREVLPIAAVLMKLVEFGIGMAIVAVFLALYRWPIHGTLLWLPAIVAVHVLFTIALALPLSALNLYYHDVRYLVGVALTLGMFLSPIMYPMEAVPAAYRAIFGLNPNTAFINAYRRVVLMGEAPDLANLAIGLAVTALALAVGYYLFKRMERGFADII